MCGVIGVFGHSNAGLETYKGLLTLQHRGQDAAGLTSSTYQSFSSLKGFGTINESFSPECLDELKGHMAIGHTRYSTQGGHIAKNIQPYVATSPMSLGIAYNGNIANYHQLSEELQQKNIKIDTTSDTEIIHRILMIGLNQFKNFFKALEYTYEKLVGGYAVLGMIPDQGFFAFRDPNGLRPLLFGQKKNHITNATQYIFSSEQFTLDYLEYETIRDVGPGEVIFIDNQGNVESKVIRKNKLSPCMLEWVYFSGPEGSLEKTSVYSSRVKLGISLAGQVKNLITNKTIMPDIVAPIPDSGRIAAQSLAKELEIPFKEILIKNRYIQRSFIQKSQNERLTTLKLKFRPVKSEIKGKNILLVDDSLVRGNTVKTLCELLKKLEAKEIYFALTCPPIRYPCYYGIDFPDSHELIAGNKTVEEIENELGVNKIIYINQTGLHESIGLPNLCTACLDAKYPTSIKEAQLFAKARINLRRTMES